MNLKYAQMSQQQFQLHVISEVFIRMKKGLPADYAAIALDLQVPTIKKTTPNFAVNNAGSLLQRYPNVAIRRAITRSTGEEQGWNE